MSVVAVLQGNEKEDRQSTLAALELARRLNTPVTGLFALPDPNAVLMVSATPEAAGLTASTAQSIIEMQLAMKRTAETTFHDVTSMGAHGLDCDFFHEVNTVERACANAGAGCRVSPVGSEERHAAIFGIRACHDGCASAIGVGRQ